MAKSKIKLSEGEVAVLTGIALGNYNLGDYWTGSVAHLKKAGLIFCGRVGGKCLVYLTPKGMKLAWEEYIDQELLNQ